MLDDPDAVTRNAAPDQPGAHSFEARRAQASSLGPGPFVALGGRDQRDAVSSVCPRRGDQALERSHGRGLDRCALVREQDRAAIAVSGIPGRARGRRRLDALLFGLALGLVFGTARLFLGAALGILFSLSPLRIRPALGVGAALRFFLGATRILAPRALFFGLPPR